jgi:hypothetical protein
MACADRRNAARVEFDTDGRASGTEKSENEFHSSSHRCAARTLRQMEFELAAASMPLSTATPTAASVCWQEDRASEA